MNLDAERIIDIISKAMPQKSEHCLNDGIHNYLFALHVQSKENTSFYYKCSICDEIIVTTKYTVGKGKIN